MDKKVMNEDFNTLGVILVPVIVVLLAFSFLSLTQADESVKGWEAQFKATALNNDRADNATFGVRSDASENWDNYDVEEPPAPPAPYVRAFFYYPDLSPETMHGSYLPPDNSLEWPLWVQFADTADNVLLEWDVDNIPPKYTSIQLLDDAGNVLVKNMRDTENYRFKVKGSELDPGLYDFTVRMIEDTTAPSGMRLLIPADDSLSDDSVTFEWSEVTEPNFENYELYIEGNLENSFDRISKTSTTVMLDNGNYSWHMVANDAAGNENISDTWTVNVDNIAPTEPSLKSPGDGVLLDNSTVTFEWSEVTEANFENYELYCNGRLKASTRFLSATETSLIVSDGSYNWKIVANDMVGNENQSSVETFTVDTTAPTVPSPVSPADGALENVSTLTLDWEASSDATAGVENYVVYVDSSARKTVTDTSATVSFADGSHSWKVGAFDSAGNENVSDSRSLTVDTTAPQIENIEVENINCTSTVVSWETDENSTTLVEYGKTDAYSENKRIEGLVKDHSLTLTGLSPNSTYHYRIVTEDDAGNIAKSSDRTFTTPSIFKNTNLRISPGVINVGEKVTISTIIVNMSQSITENHTVTLKVNDNIVGSKTVELSPKEDKWVSFEISRGKAGSYSVEINELKGDFTVIRKDEVEAKSPVTKIENIESGANRKVKVENTVVTGLNITARGKVENAGVSVQQFENVLSGVPELENAQIYKSFNIATENMTSKDVENVTVSFKISRVWVENNGIVVDTIRLQRFDPENREWNNLPTEKIGENEDFYYFEAISPRLSVYSATGVSGVISFKVRNLGIQPEEAESGETVLIDAIVKNTGNVKGTRKIKLHINNKLVKRKTIALDAGELREVSFKVSREEPGSYNLTLDDLSNSFEVLEPAEFEVTNLNIEPTSPEPEQEVTISCWVKNTGEIQDSYPVILREGVSRLQTVPVTLDGGESRKVRFTMDDLTPSETYYISVDGLSGEFTVKSMAGKRKIQLPEERPETPYTALVSLVISIGVIVLMLVLIFGERKRS